MFYGERRRGLWRGVVWRRGLTSCAVGCGRRAAALAKQALHNGKFKTQRLAWQGRKNQLFNTGKRLIKLHAVH